jgi:hypothetical protein
MLSLKLRSTALFGTRWDFAQRPRPPRRPASRRQAAAPARARDQRRAAGAGLPGRGLDVGGAAGEEFGATGVAGTDRWPRLREGTQRRPGAPGAWWGIDAVDRGRPSTWVVPERGSGDAERRAARRIEKGTRVDAAGQSHREGAAMTLYVCPYKACGGPTEKHTRWAENDRRDGQRGSRRGGSGHLPPGASIPASRGESRSDPFPPRRTGRQAVSLPGSSATRPVARPRRSSTR